MLFKKKDLFLICISEINVPEFGQKKLLFENIFNQEF